MAKAPRDGSVLLLTSSSFLTAAATQRQLPYDPLTAFTPVAMVGQVDILPLLCLVILPVWLLVSARPQMIATPAPERAGPG